MLYEELPVSESPQDRYAVETCVPGSLYVHVRVAYIYRCLPLGAHLAHGYLDHVGSRFPSRSLPLSDSDIHHPVEPCSVQFCHSSLQLVADDTHPYAHAPEGEECLHYSVVETCCVLAVVDIVLLECPEDIVEERVLLSSVDGSCDEHPHTVADKLSHLIECPLPHAPCSEGVVCGSCEIVERVEQRAIEVPYDSVVSHCASPLCLCYFFVVYLLGPMGGCHPVSGYLLGPMGGMSSLCLDISLALWGDVIPVSGYLLYLLIVGFHPTFSRHCIV